MLKGSKSNIRKPLDNYAFIDAQNLYKGVAKLGWRLDYYRLRYYLQAKFGVREAFIFIGYIEENKNLYKHLESCGFKLVFKKVVYDKNNIPKGNVDVDLTVHAMKYISEYKQAVFITSDGDFASLINYLKSINKFKNVISPEESKCSHLLKKEVGGNIVYLTEVRSKIEEMKKRPSDH